MSSAELTRFIASLRYEDVPTAGHRAYQGAVSRLGRLRRWPELTPAPLRRSTTFARAMGPEHGCR